MPPWCLNILNTEMQSRNGGQSVYPGSARFARRDELGVVMFEFFAVFLVGLVVGGVLSKVFAFALERFDAIVQDLLKRLGK